MSRTLDAAIVEAARATPSGWAYLTSGGKARVKPHVEEIDRLVCDLEARRLHIGIVEAPPRHGKSYTTTEKAASWYLGRNPTHRVGIITYGADLAEDFGRKNRNDMEQHGRAVFGVVVDPRSTAVNDWHLSEHDGGMISVGVNGAITGRGIDFLIIDDPIKNQTEALSSTYREKLWALFTSTVRTRLEPGGVVLVIQTRWHEDDLAGRLKRHYADRADARILTFPAIAEADDPLGRKPGEALWPERYNEANLAETRELLGSYVWNALYQQQPVAVGGNVLRTAWWQRFDELPQRIAERADEVIISADLAFKDSDGSDRVSIQVWAQILADSFLLDNHTDVLDYPATRTAIRNMVAKWPMANAKLVEDKANGSAIIADLKHEIAGLIPVEPQGGKMARVVAVSPFIESGNVYLPTRAIAPWVDDFISECAAFPNGAHDDQADAASQALLRLTADHRPATARGVYGGSNGEGETTQGGHVERDARGLRKRKRHGE